MVAPDLVHILEICTRWLHQTWRSFQNLGGPSANSQCNALGVCARSGCSAKRSPPIVTDVSHWPNFKCGCGVPLESYIYYQKAIEASVSETVEEVS